MIRKIDIEKTIREIEKYAQEYWNLNNMKSPYIKRDEAIKIIRSNIRIEYEHFDKEKLIIEKEKLLSRLTEINNMLGEN